MEQRERVTTFLNAFDSALIAFGGRTKKKNKKKKKRKRASLACLNVPDLSW
jgi:hypothetical protein